ncbi:hypothetical protein, partial [Microtetraspora fusca]|uniref:hypothetical protein n=1 Tax=Microtetraspora fusca TaxID=1997 RepID=UPI001C3F2A4E
MPEFFGSVFFSAPDERRSSPGPCDADWWEHITSKAKSWGSDGSSALAPDNGWDLFPYVPAGDVPLFPGSRRERPRTGEPKSSTGSSASVPTSEGAVGHDGAVRSREDSGGTFPAAEGLGGGQAEDGTPKHEESASDDNSSHAGQVSWPLVAQVREVASAVAVALVPD